MKGREIPLPYSKPSIGDEEISAVIATMRAGHLSAGPQVRVFEEQFAKYIGSSHAIAVNSCTSALEVALAALGVGPGDEVIVPTLTFCATANVVEHLGATPVLVDVDPHLQISPEAVRRAVTRRTRIIMPVHYGGQACDLEAIEQIAEEHQLKVVQDAAHAVGTDYQGRKIGNSSNITAFSFYPSKNMTTGEGGMLTVSDNTLVPRLRQLVTHGIYRSEHCLLERNRFWHYEVIMPGYKANMPEVLAAIGIEQLKKLDGFMQRRRQIATRYNSVFAQLTGIVTPSDLPFRPHGYHLYTLRIAVTGFDRDIFLQRLEKSNITASVHFTPLHRHPYYSRKYQYSAGAFPNADSFCRQIVSLPIYPAMSDDDVEDVIEAVCSALSSLSPAAGAGELAEQRDAADGACSSE